MKLDREWHQAHRRELNAEIHEEARARCALVRKEMREASKNASVRVLPPATPQVNFRDWRMSLKANRLQHARVAKKEKK